MKSQAVALAAYLASFPFGTATASELARLVCLGLEDDYATRTGFVAVVLQTDSTELPVADFVASHPDYEPYATVERQDLPVFELYVYHSAPEAMTATDPVVLASELLQATPTRIETGLWLTRIDGYLSFQWGNAEGELLKIDDPDPVDFERYSNHRESDHDFKTVPLDCFDAFFVGVPSN